MPAFTGGIPFGFVPLAAALTISAAWLLTIAVVVITVVQGFTLASLVRRTSFALELADVRTGGNPGTEAPRADRPGSPGRLVRSGSRADRCGGGVAPQLVGALPNGSKPLRMRCRGTGAGA